MLVLSHIDNILFILERRKTDKQDYITKLVGIPHNKQPMSKLLVIEHS